MKLGSPLFWQWLIAFSLLPLGVAAAPADIPIAVVGPMTGSSGLVGQGFVDGVALAIDDINARGGLLGRKLRFIAVDDACSVDQATAAARTALAEGAAVVIGHYCSAASITAAPIYAKANVVQISPRSSNPALTEMGIPSVFRMVGRDDREGEIIAEYISGHWAAQRIGVIDDGQVYGKGLADVIRQGLAKRATPVALNLAFAPNAKSYAGVVAELRRKKIGILFIGGYGADIGLLARQIASAGLTITLIASDSALAGTVWDVGGKATNGLLFVKEPDFRARPEAAPLAAAARARGIELSIYVIDAYAAVEVWAAAAARADSVDATQVAAVLHEMPFNSVLGPVSFDSKGDIMGLPGQWAWYRWTNGNIIAVAPH